MPVTLPIATRLAELYRTGGTNELARGIGDWAATHRTADLITRLFDAATLTIDSAAVKLHITEREDVFRARGHGERDVLETFVGALESDDVVWDIGANIGTYALLAAQCGAQVHAFEPGDNARDRLRANAALNDLAPTIHDYALADEDGTATLSHESRSGVRELTDGAGDPVQTRRGDGLELPSPDIVKIDVEGAELAVLEGLGDRLRDCRRCFVEVHDAADQQAVTERLERRGFEVSAPFERRILQAEREERDR
ncbi:FkbM family methyltransferase [Natrinema versiforme]|uniref:Methyltransferase FkbM domain-containing protein n=1 Tax=Natrinema versiforme JCM 10478 TaxID=1227496 RepID=L9Y445_9EURY|nr:FkbM family methyltransferase [Natrinema versiforme]ELY68835.1 hypothetical protein C489_05698 [Natrinema versiforme JCM 10478]